MTNADSHQHSSSKNFLYGIFHRILSPLEEFIHKESSSGIVLMFCTVLAMILANSPWQKAYDDLLHTYLTLSIGQYSLKMSVHHFINDGLMAVFFFVVGLEIKREILIGELSQPRQAILPVSSALGGMLVPALLYLMFNSTGETVKGWGIPMATDIAFALGVLSLLGNRVPKALISLLLALAIVDDLGAVLVIALFYTDSLNMLALAAAAVCFVMLLTCNLAGIRSPLVYLALGILLWFAMLQSGVHATLAGVLSALTIPARSAAQPASLVDTLRQLARTFVAESPARTGDSHLEIVRNESQQILLNSMSRCLRRLESPLIRLEHSLHSLVAFGIMPIFALANGGISLDFSTIGSMLCEPVSLGVAVGLVVGKTAGVFLFAATCIILRLSKLPTGVTYRHLFGMAILSGIGFTMSIFIGSLAFADLTHHLHSAKIGIVTASLISGLLGYLWLLRCK